MTYDLFFETSTRKGLPRRSIRTEIIRPPWSFWKTTAIISLCLATLLSYAGFEFCMQDIISCTDAYEGIRIEHGPIFYGAMNTYAQSLRLSITIEFLMAYLCLALATVSLWYAAVLILRRIRIHVTEYPAQP